MRYLEYMQDGSSRSFPLFKAETLIGRGVECDLILPQDYVSQRHAVLVVSPDGVELRDLGSRNGTWIGETRVQVAELHVDRSFRIGHDVFYLREGEGVQLTDTQQMMFRLPDPEELEADPLPHRVTEPAITARDAAMVKLLEKCRLFAKGVLPILITGESGTGKEWFARFIHTYSFRRDSRYEVVCCSGVAEERLTAELFDPHNGKIIQVGSGTLVLDEIGNLPLSLQTRLLQMMRNSADSPEVPRFIALSNMDLPQMVERFLLHRELYERFSGLTVSIPPLRNRADDIEPLVEHFTRLFCNEMGKEVKGFTPGAVDRLFRYDWPGNIRQLKNVVNRAVAIVQDGHEIDEALLSRENLLAGPVEGQ